MVAPVNDNWANATYVTIPNNGDTYSSPLIPNAEATMESGESNPTGFSVGNKTLWWQYVPLSSGTATFGTATTTGASDTEMGIYTGASLGTLTKIASGNDSGPGGGALLSNIAVTAGTTYYIQVGVYQGSNAMVGLTVTGPAAIDPTPVPYEPMNLALADLGVSWLKFTWGAPGPAPVPTSYDVRVDGGAIVSVGNTFEYIADGFAENSSHTFEVRSHYLSKMSAWVSITKSTLTGTTTRWYTQRGAPEVDTTPSGDWHPDTLFGTTPEKGRLARVRGGITNDWVGMNSGTSPGGLVGCWFGTGPADLPAGEIKGTFRMVSYAYGQYHSAPLIYRLKVVNAAGTAVRGVLVNTTRQRNWGEVGPQTHTVTRRMDPVTAVAGDRLYLEVGQNIPDINYSCSFGIGSEDGTGTTVDMPFVDGQYWGGNHHLSGWFEIITPIPPVTSKLHLGSDLVSKIQVGASASKLSLGPNVVI